MTKIPHSLIAQPEVLAATSRDLYDGRGSANLKRLDGMDGMNGTNSVLVENAMPE